MIEIRDRSRRLAFTSCGLGYRLKESVSDPGFLLKADPDSNYPQPQESIRNQNSASVLFKLYFHERRSLSNIFRLKFGGRISEFGSGAI
jgi:hypothetical protein